MTIDQIIEKAFTTADLANGGLLNPDQAAKLIQGIFEIAVVTVEARKVPMNANKKVIDKMTYTGDILQKPVAVGTEHTTTTKPVTSKVILDAQEAIVALDIAYETLEDNIEKDNLMNSILDMTSRRLGFEIDKLLLHGDASGSTGTVLDIFDGVFKHITSNVYDAAASPITEVHLQKALKALPSEYFQNEGAFRFYVSHICRLDYINVLASKNVNDAFSQYLTGVKEPSLGGVPVRKVGAIKTIADVGGGKPGSDAILIDPKNIVWGIHRDITMEMERKPRKRIIEVTMTMKMDVRLEREDAAVKITNLEYVPVV